MVFVRKKKIGNNYYYYAVRSVRTGPNSWKKYEKYIGKRPYAVKKVYDVAIIGAGPAGLFAAYELCRRNLNVVVVDGGKDIRERKGEIMRGVGGAGLFSDGKLNLTPVHGKTNLLEFLPMKKALDLVYYVDRILVSFGAPKKSYTRNIKKANKLRERAIKLGISLLLIPQKHIGSDCLPLIMGKFVDYLKKNRIEIRTETEVKEIIVNKDKTIFLDTNKNKIKARFVIACPGRYGHNWMAKQAQKLRIPIKHRGIEVGIRVEVQAKVMKKVTDIVWDPPFFLRSRITNDNVRTFCTNPNGFVAKEVYHGFNCVNGYCRKDKKSKNTNFALLSNIELTKPAENTIAYGEEIGALANTIGGGKPFIQRLVDLKRNKRSFWYRIEKSKVNPTLKNVTPGDLSMAIPHRIVNNVMDALKQLNKLIPGIDGDVLLYGPELKFFSVRLQTNKNLETSVRNLFVAGDGVGVCGNIVGAAATGIIAARGVFRRIAKK